MWIGGTAVAGTGQRLPVSNPAAGETVDEVPVATGEEVDAAGVSGRRLDDRERNQEAAAHAEPSAAFTHSPARK